MFPDIPGGEPLDPTDPAAHDATLEHLRGLIAKHEEGSPASSMSPADDPAPEKKPKRAAKTELQTHEEWVDRGREIALRQLGFSARSSEQLRQAMLDRDVPSAAANEVIERLTRVGLIDDEEYAAMLVRTRHAERGLARRSLMLELARKGIDSATAERALEQIDEADEDEAARELVRKRVRSMRNLDPTTRRNRLYGTLGRKGYGASAARAAIDAVLTEEGLALY